MNLKKESKCHVGFLRSSLIRGNPLTHCLTPIPADPLHAGLVLASCPTGLAPPLPYRRHRRARLSPTATCWADGPAPQQSLGLGHCGFLLLSNFMLKLSSTLNNSELHQMFE